MAKWKTAFHVVLLITVFTLFYRPKVLGLQTQSYFFWFSLFYFLPKSNYNRKYVFLYSLTGARFLTINNRNRFFFYIKQNLFIFFRGLENFLKERKFQFSKDWSPSRGGGGGGVGGTLFLSLANKTPFNCSKCTVFKIKTSH